MIVASSYGNWAGASPVTSDIQKAMDTRQIQPFRGRDPVTGERIIAVSSPMLYSNGEVIGVLRYVTSTKAVDAQIAYIAIFSLLSLLIVLAVVLFSSNYYIHSILFPLGEIIDKAKRIAAGSYGSQIQTKYDDEIGELADTINEMSLQISQNEKVQRDFISSLSHELRTPLTSITGWSETLLAGDTLDPDTRRGMRIILREGKCNRFAKCS
jgi:signal transduction histidine kinase